MVHRKQKKPAYSKGEKSFAPQKIWHYVFGYWIAEAKSQRYFFSFDLWMDEVIFFPYFPIPPSP